VSPLWRDEVVVLFAPGELVLTRRRRGVRSRCVADTRRTVEAFELTNWAPALAILVECLNEAAWQGANVRVVLSNHWARYAIVPWENHITSDDERLALARIGLSKIYGSIDQWHVGLSHAAPGEPRVAVAIANDLFEGVRAAVEASGSQLVAMQPQLIVSYNSWLPRLQDAAGWFVNIDEGALAAARLSGVGWDRVYCARIGTDWALELDRLRTFGRLAVNDGGGSRVYVAAPDWLRQLAGAPDDGIEWLHDAGAEPAATGERALLTRLYI
jgi:hypothetical protein